MVATLTPASDARPAVAAGRFVRCIVGGMPFALPLASVAEVVAIGTATATAPRGWIGTLARNERPVPIGDLAFLLGFPHAPLNRREVRALILRASGTDARYGVTRGGPAGLRCRGDARGAVAIRRDVGARAGREDAHPGWRTAPRPRRRRGHRSPCDGHHARAGWANHRAARPAPARRRTVGSVPGPRGQPARAIARRTSGDPAGTAGSRRWQRHGRPGAAAALDPGGQPLAGGAS